MFSSQTIQIQSYDDSASRDLQISDPGNLYRWSVLPAHEITGNLSFVIIKLKFHLETSQPTTEALPHFYGDLIKYYNRIFIPRVQEFAKNLLPNDSLHDEVIMIFPFICYFFLIIMRHIRITRLN